MDKETLNQICRQYGTPTYVFHADVFCARIAAVQKILGAQIQLCYSIKANPFLLSALPPDIDWIEVCSPGELAICKALHICMHKIIFSGVNKTEDSVLAAMEEGVGLFTAESPAQLALIEQCAAAQGKTVPVLLRLSNGNQFGMDAAHLTQLIQNRGHYAHTEITGIHYYTGTQKKKVAAIEKELEQLHAFLQLLQKEYGFSPDRIEYGPGLAVDYFGQTPETTDELLMQQTAQVLHTFAARYPLSIEMGRFFAAPCGTYLTQVVDTKLTNGIQYAICDGGVHQLQYYGQNMGMQVPSITVLSPVNDKRLFWSVCGSLCTTADVLVRKAELTGLGCGSVLAFERCGAYSVTEGMSLFLSRELPRVLLYDENTGAVLARDLIQTSHWNTPIKEDTKRQ